MRHETGLELYNRTAAETAAVMIKAYSTSFGLASRLLVPRTRQQIETIYALVRLADEIVDGVASAAALPQAEIRRLLDDLEAETASAIRTGYSVNLVVHAFALTARRTGIGTDLTAPFFRSMRADLLRAEHTRESFDDYVYGSAEVVGLMCLQCFLDGRVLPSDEEKRLREGAQRLGAAFQKVNFLRDLAEDFETLGRSYFPGITVDAFTETDKHRILDDIEADLRISGAAIAELPRECRAAVALAQELFTDLAARMRRTPAALLRTTRIRVPNPVKLRLAAEVILARGLRRRSATALSVSDAERAP